MPSWLVGSQSNTLFHKMLVKQFFLLWSLNLLDCSIHAVFLVLFSGLHRKRFPFHVKKEPFRDLKTVLTPLSVFLSSKYVLLATSSTVPHISAAFSLLTSFGAVLVREAMWCSDLVLTFMVKYDQLMVEQSRTIISLRLHCYFYQCSLRTTFGS